MLHCLQKGNNNRNRKIYETQRGGGQGGSGGSQREQRRIERERLSDARGGAGRAGMSEPFAVVCKFFSAGRSGALNKETLLNDSLSIS